MGRPWSGSFKSSDELAPGCPHHTIFALLDTRFETRVERRLARRKATNGNGSNLRTIMQRLRDVIPGA